MKDNPIRHASHADKWSVSPYLKISSCNHDCIMTKRGQENDIFRRQKVPLEGYRKVKLALGEDDMVLGERIKQLRTKRGWKQLELAREVGIDGGQISRYENGRITPSVEVLVKLAESLNVSTDYLLFEAVPQRPLSPDDPAFIERIGQMHHLTENDKATLLHVLDAFLVKTQVQSAAREFS